MKFTRAVFVLLVGMFHIILINGHDPEPRIVCKTLMPVMVEIPHPPPGVTIKSPTSWIVAKTTRMKPPYPEGYDEHTNTCRPQSYGPNCMGIQYLRVPDANSHGYTTHMYADHRSTPKIYAHFEDYFHSKDDEYQMYQGQFKNMEVVVDHEQPGTPVETIPDFVKHDHGDKIIGVVDMPADGRWLIFASCDKKFAMVVLTWQFPITDSPQTIWARSQGKINERLTKLGLDVSSMVDLPLDSFEFKMYEAIFGKKVREARKPDGEGTSTQGEDWTRSPRSHFVEPSTSGAGADPADSPAPPSRVGEPSTSGGVGTIVPESKDGHESPNLTIEQRTGTEVHEVEPEITEVEEGSSRRHTS